MTDHGAAEPIDRLIGDFRAGVTGDAGRGLAAVQTQPRAAVSSGPGQTLRQAVFDVLAGALAGSRQLLLAPDGDLTRLPFEALPAGNGRHLIDDYQISYVVTGRDALRFGVRSGRAPAAALVIADPDFDLAAAPGVQTARSAGRRAHDLDRGLRFSRLPGTRREGERIADLFGVKPCLDAAALEARLKGCRSPRVLYLATHGFFLADERHDPARDWHELGASAAAEGSAGRLSTRRLENPLLRSGLALAGANTWLQEGSAPAEAEDGLLTAEDVTGMDLLDTELVVLSACETALGEVRVGEGVFGLRRAFVLAGARTLVMSLWKVPDRQTQELMEDYYRRLLSGQPRAEALRQAQLAVKARHPDPHFWGAFICQGDPAALLPGAQA
jgi:CHAT domain-containing protein